MKTVHTLVFLDPESLHRLAEARESRSQRVVISLDLWRSRMEVQLKDGNILLPNEQQIRVPPIDRRKHLDTRTIWVWRGGTWQKWQRADPITGRFYKPVFLKPGAPPTLEISGIKMHVTGESEQGDPARDTRNKIRALGRTGGNVLDLCTGLGYTAIALSRLAAVRWVLSVEKDAFVLQLCRENPWSRELFASEKISLLQMDAFRWVQLAPDRHFTAIVHDPPRFALAPALYSLEFYRHCYRILRQGGKMYHYTGEPGRRRGQDLPARTASRLKQAGFSSVRRCYQGVCAKK